MSSEAQEGWRESALGDLCQIAIGGTPPRRKPEYWAAHDGGHPWVAISDMRDAVIHRTKERITDAGVANSNVKPVAAGTVLMSFKLTIGRVAVAGIDLFTNEAIAAFQPGAKLDKSFLPYWLEHIVANADTDQAIKGATLNKKKLAALSGVLPPLDEQQRIAEVLRSVDAAIAASDALLKGVKATKQGAMEAALSGQFDEVRLETLLAETRYPMRSGPFGSALLKSELQPEGIPFLGIDNVHVERFVPVYRRFVSDEKYRELARYTVYPGDVMVTIMGTVGRCCVVPSDVGTAISSKHVWTLTLDQSRYSPALLAWQINHSPAVLAQLQGSAQGGIMSAISSGTLRELLVPLPSPDEVEQIERLLLSFNAEIAALEAQQEQSRELKAALMSDLLCGRVRVPA
ncbi:restriction endonuclease subunit S [Citromicrobium bathyomarinum]